MAPAITLSCLVVFAACGGVSADDPDAGPTTDADRELDAGDDADAADFAPNIAFVTRTQHSGNLGGLSGADGICNASALESGLDGSYVAWLSTETVDARDRIGTASGWVRPDGRPFGNTIDDILAGRILYPPYLDQTGARVGGFIWTATTSEGSYFGDGSCGAWSTEIGNSLLGDSSAGVVRFTSSDVNACAEPARLLCLGVDRPASLEAPNDVGRIAFVSAGSVAGNAGLDSLDAICASEAADAGFSGVFSSAVFAGGETLAQRFDIEAETWVRPDGVKIFEEARDLENPSAALAPIQVAADGSVVDSTAWTGQTPGIPRNCVDFTDSDGTGVAGITSFADGRWLFGASSACSAEHRVYCFER